MLGSLAFILPQTPRVQMPLGKAGFLTHRCRQNLILLTCASVWPPPALLVTSSTRLSKDFSLCGAGDQTITLHTHALPLCSSPSLDNFKLNHTFPHLPYASTHQVFNAGVCVYVCVCGRMLRYQYKNKTMLNLNLVFHRKTLKTKPWV